MSRMAIPTMDVVRFKEADVLCASGVRLAGFNNSVSGDATINGKSIDAFVSILKDTNPAGTNVWFKYDGKGFVHEDDIDDHEETGELADGVYTMGTGDKDGQTITLWTWQHQ